MHRTRLRRPLAAFFPAAVGFACLLGRVGAADPLPHPAAAAPSAVVQDAPPVLRGPILTTSPAANGLTQEQAAAGDMPLPISLAAALRLADARPLVIAAAQASVAQAAAALGGARALWLPNFNLGGSYYRHDGGGAGNSGAEFINGRDQVIAGYGLTLTVEGADALFTPLALKQVLRSREIDVQTARNDALQNVAEAYFNVQQARGRLAGARDAVVKGRELARKITALGRELTAPIEADRARAQLLELEQEATRAYEAWRVASAELTRVLRLYPGAVVVPIEPPHLQVTLIAPSEPVDALVSIGLTNRPELASQQALVQATLVRLRQERLRPLIPSVVLLGDAVPASPGGYLSGGVFYSDASGQANPLSGRNDVSVQLIWQLRNLGLGNKALVNERRAEQQRALIELYRVQDQVAAEVAQAHAQVQSAAIRVGQAEDGLQQAQTTYAGNLRGLGQTMRVGNTDVLIYRPQEVVAALAMLQRAYDNYFRTANDYNRAQFRLYRAVGYPAGILACERPSGPVVGVDVTRPPQMAPVAAAPAW
jgi:outer membrane protein TolC